MWPSPQETADLVTFTGKKFLMESFIFCAVFANMDPFETLKRSSRLLIIVSSCWLDSPREILCEKCPDKEFFLVRIFLYSDQKNSVFGHFSHSAAYN